MIKINNLSLPAPSSLGVKISPQAGSAQYNTLGQLVQDGMRDKRTVEITWARMEHAMLASLAQALSAGGFFSCTYPDPLAGQRQMTCRVTGQSAQVFHYAEGVPTWAEVKLTLEER